MTTPTHVNDPQVFSGLFDAYPDGVLLVAPLRHVPKDKSVSLGLITTKSAALEPVDLLRRRIDLASKYIDLSQLGICPQCGFASTVGGNDVTLEDEIAKLKLLTSTAQQVWGGA